MERSWKGHKQVSASQYDVIKDRFEAFVGMDSATLQHACERFRPRIEAVIQANGECIE